MLDSLLLKLVLWSQRGGQYFVHIAGAGRLYPTPLPNNLFSIEEGCLLYDVQVEQDQPEEEVPEEDEEQASKP